MAFDLPTWMTMDQLDLFHVLSPAAPPAAPRVIRDARPTVSEFKVQTVRECMVREKRPIMVNPAIIAAFFREHVATAPWFDSMKECAVVFALDTKNRVLGWNLVSLGTVNATPVQPRECLRPVIVAAATGFVLAHSHPSGDPMPSTADVSITRQIRSAADVVGIPMRDHIIIGEASLDPNGIGYYSFKKAMGF